MIISTSELLLKTGLVMQSCKSCLFFFVFYSVLIPRRPKEVLKHFSLTSFTRNILPFQEEILYFHCGLYRHCFDFTSSWNILSERTEEILEINIFVLPDIDHFVVLTIWLLHGKRANKSHRKIKLSYLETWMGYKPSKWVVLRWDNDWIWLMCVLAPVQLIRIVPSILSRDGERYEMTRYKQLWSKSIGHKITLG